MLTATDLMGQSANISFDLKIPHVTATTARVDNMLTQGRLGDHLWEMEVDTLFTDPKGCPLVLSLSDDQEGCVTLTDGLVQVDLHELREAAFTVSATDIFGARAEVPFALRVPGPTASVSSISETIKTGPFQDGTWERELASLFREPKGTALTYTLSDDFGGKVQLTDGRLKADCRGLKTASFTVTATDEYGLSAEIPVTLTEKNMTARYALYGLGGLIPIASLIGLAVYLRRKDRQ